MMKNKYYTPNIKEFHVGFEFQYLYETGAWGNETIRYSSISNFTVEDISPMLQESKIRVKYLDQEDIQSLGFEPSFDEPDEWFHRFKGNENIQLYYDDKTREKNQGIGITIYYDVLVFNGYIKNKSELKKLLQQLNILK